MILPLRGVTVAILFLLTCTAPSAARAQEEKRASLGEEVRYPSDPGTVLAGTLEIPRAKRTGPLPVAIIISGTGPWLRGGWVNIRARLHAAGIATLMYDKRGLGQSTGTFTDTIPEMERDVAAAVAFLRTRRDIDPKGIALIGTSQGGVAGPLVASKDKAIAAVVTLSGPVGPRGDMFISILRSYLKGNGKNPGQVERVANAVSAWMDARTQNVAPANAGRMRTKAVDAFVEVGFPLAEAQKFAATLDTDVLLSMFDAAPDRNLAAVRAPVLAIVGSQDTILAPDLVASTAAALDDNADGVVVVVPGMTHELQRARPIAGAPPVEDSTMPIVTELVGAWLAARLPNKPPT